MTASCMTKASTVGRNQPSKVMGGNSHRGVTGAAVSAAFHEHDVKHFPHFQHKHSTMGMESSSCCIVIFSWNNPITWGPRRMADSSGIKAPTFGMRVSSRGMRRSKISKLMQELTTTYSNAVYSAVGLDVGAPALNA